MGAILDWFHEVMRFRRSKLWTALGETAAHTHLRAFALETCAKLIASRATLATFQTEDKMLYYRLNVKPNQNQNASEFWNGVYRRMITEGEAVVYQDNAHHYQLYLVDDFFVDDSNPLKGYQYKSLRIGNKVLKGPYQASELYHFRMSNDRLDDYLNQLDRSYSKLFNRLVEVQMLQSQLRVYANFKAMMGKRRDDQQAFIKFLEDFKQSLLDNLVVVTPTQDDWMVNEHSAQYLGRSVEELQRLEHVYLTDVCQILSIPPVMFNGELADISEHKEEFVRTIHSLLHLVATEINSKQLAGTGELFDPKTSVQVVLFHLVYNTKFEASATIEKLISSGICTIDDVLVQMGEQRIQDEYTSKRYMTLNVAPIEAGWYAPREERDSSDPVDRMKDLTKKINERR